MPPPESVDQRIRDLESKIEALARRTAFLYGNAKHNAELTTAVHEMMSKLLTLVQNQGQKHTELEQALQRLKDAMASSPRQPQTKLED